MPVTLSCRSDDDISSIKDLYVCHDVCVFMTGSFFLFFACQSVLCVYFPLTVSINSVEMVSELMVF